MKRIALTAKRSQVEKYKKLYRRVHKILTKLDKEVYVDEPVARVMGLKKYRPFKRGRTDVDLVIVMGGDGTILSVVRSMRKFNAQIFGINIGRLGFMSEIPPAQIEKTLAKIFKGEYTIDNRLMLHVEVRRKGKVVKKFHALNEAAIVHGKLARLINLRTKVNNRKLTTYHADGLIVSTPTGSTAYSLSAGGPIVYPTLQTFILTPIAPHSFTQKPIIIPSDKLIEIVVESKRKQPNLTIDGQESIPLQYKDEVVIKKDGKVNFVRLPSESFFKTLREKLHWGEKLEN